MSSFACGTFGASPFPKLGDDTDFGKSDCESVKPTRFSELSKPPLDSDMLMSDLVSVFVLLRNNVV